MEKKKKKKGRPEKYGEPTKLVRVPVSKIAEIKEHLKNKYGSASNTTAKQQV